MTTQTQVRSTEEALKLALEALKPRAGMPEPEYESLVNCAITAIKEALAQQSNEQVEPVAFETWYEKFHSFVGKSPLLYSDLHCAWQAAKLYTTPPQRTWVGLTDDEVNELVEHTECEDYYGLVEATEAKLKEKNT